MSEFNPRLLMIACVCAALVAAFTIDLYVAVPQMTTGHYGVDLSRAPSWTALTSLGWALGQFFSGKLLDFGVRRGLSLSILGAVGFSTLALFAPFYEVGLALRLLAGMCAGLTFASVRLFLRQVCVDEGLGQMMSTFSIAFLGGILLAPVVGVYAFKFIGFWGVIGAHAALCLAALPVMLFLPQKTNLKIAPPSQDPRGVELPTWTTQCVYGSSSFLGGLTLSFFPVVLVQEWGNTDWLPAFTIPSLLIGMLIAYYNRSLLNKFRLLHVMNYGLLIAFVMFSIALCLALLISPVYGFMVALMFGYPFFANSGSNAEAISLSRTAKSYSALAYRRAVPVTLGNLFFVAVAFWSEDIGVTGVSLWPHMLITLMLVGLVFYYQFLVQRQEIASNI